MMRSETVSKHQAELQKEGPYHEPEFITITVTDPVTAYDSNAKPYTTYELSTETTFPQYKARTSAVRRRYRSYSDFVALDRHLREKIEDTEDARKHGPIADLPGDTLTSFFGSGRFEPGFIAERRKALEKYINAAANHTFCRFDKELQDFLQDPKWDASRVTKAQKGWWFLIAQFSIESRVGMTDMEWLCFGEKKRGYCSDGLRCC